MASSSAIAEAKQDAIDLIQDLTEDGWEVSVGNYKAPAEEWKNDDEYVEVAKTNVLTVKHDKDFSDDVQTSDVFYLASNEVDYNSVLVLIDQGKEYEVKHFEPIIAAGLTVGNIIQVR